MSKRSGSTRSQPYELAVPFAALPVATIVYRQQQGRVDDGGGEERDEKQGTFKFSKQVLPQ